MVSVVGDGLTTGARAAPALLASSGNAGVTPRAVHAGPLRLSADRSTARTARCTPQRALHAAFVGQDRERSDGNAPNGSYSER